MANTHITTIFIIGTLVIWILMFVVIFKLFCDRHKELKMVREIAVELQSIRKDIKLLH